MAYIIKRIKEHKKNASGGYDIVHRETEASLTLLNDASTAQEHANSFIASESGVHGFKYDIVEGILEAFNEQTEEWEPIASGGAPDIQIPAIPTQSGSLVYNGSVQYPTWENFDSNQLAISGVINAVDAGMYEAIFTPKPGFVWFDGTKSVKSVVWAIGKASIGSTPTQSGTLTYNGSIQSPIWQNYNPAQLVIGGDLTGVNAGSYAVMFVPNANHQWWDGTVDGKYVPWNINKVAGSSSINPTSLTLNTSNPSGTITVTRQGDGAISAVSSNTSVATVDVSPSLVSRITDKIMPEVNEWQNRPLSDIYSVVFFDGIIFKSRKDNKIINKCVYTVLGIDMDGQKEILGFWISENESASFWASVCNDLRNRGVRDIFIACHDNLKGLNNAITSSFPQCVQQLCIIHQIRSSTKYVPWKDRKAVCTDLKRIYGAVNIEDAEFAKEEFREKWDKKYPSILRSWDANWTDLITYFDYSPEIRKLIYTTNAVEGFHRMLRKFTKTKSIFPTDDAVKKAVYMSVLEISKKWTQQIRDWGLIYSQLVIKYEDRLKAS